MNLKPLHTIVIVLLFLAIGGGAAYLSNRAASIQGPSDLSKDRSGTLYVRIHQKVFVYKRDGELQNHFELGPLGIKEVWGGLAFFQNGDLLVSPSLLTDTNTGEAGPVRDRLNRCVLSTARCQVLSGYDRSFRRTFRAFIDDNDQIFLSNSASGRVTWLTSDGNEIDELSQTLDHPNKISRDGNKMIVADTDANSLLLVPLGTSQFSTEDQWTRISTEPINENDWRVSQPVDFTRVGDGWAVLVKNNTMTKAVLRHYDTAGVFTGETKLQRNGFIIALENFAGNLVVTDYRNMRVLRFSADGSVLDDLSSPEQEDYVAELEEQKAFYDTASILAWILFGVLLIGGMIYGIRQELLRINAQKPDQASSDAPPQADTQQPIFGDTRVQWVGMPRFDLFAIIIGLLVITLISLGFVGVGTEAKANFTGMNVIWMMCGVMLVLVIVPLGIARRRLKNTNIGVRDEWVIVRFPDGTTEIARDRDLLEMNNGFIINLRKVSVGNERHSLYSKKDMEALLKPRLEKARKLTGQEQIRWEWQHNRRTTLLVGSISVILLIAVLMLELGYGEDWLKGKIRNSASSECLTEETSQQ